MRLLLAFVLCCLSLTTNALEVIRVKDTLVLAGEILYDDRAIDITGFAKAGVKTVVLYNSYGGNFDASLRIGNLIRHNNLNTVAVGSCFSGCAFIFLGGSERTFGSKRDSMIGFHSAHHKETLKIVRSVGGEISRFMLKMTDSKFPSDVLAEVAYHLEHDHMLYVRPALNNFDVIICRSIDCVPVNGITPDGIGVITSRAVTTLPADVIRVLGSIPNLTVLKPIPKR